MISIGDYISEYASSEHFMLLDAPVKKHAEQILDYFCRSLEGPVTIAAIETTLHKMARLDLPFAVRKEIPRIVSAFFEFAGSTGRDPAALQWVDDLALVEKEYRSLFREDGTVRGTTFEKKYTDVGRNDPCPCGSGKKFKKCCG
jgi:hypothetical protein